jgi:hypothetical protein
LRKTALPVLESLAALRVEIGEQCMKEAEDISGN